MIRPATPDDILAIVTVMQACGTYVAGIDYTEFSHPTLVAEVNGQVVGMIQGLIGLPYAYISEIAVLPEYHSQGIGRALKSALEDIFRSCGVKAWSGLIRDDNTPYAPIFKHVVPDARVLGKGTVYVRILA